MINQVFLTCSGFFDTPCIIERKSPIKVTCRVKANTTLATKKITFFHYFSKKVKTNILHGHKRYMKSLGWEIDHLRIQI